MVRGTTLCSLQLMAVRAHIGLMRQLDMRGTANANLTRHEEARCEVAASPTNVFEHIDQPQRLSAHMSRKSWRLAGMSMSIETDAKGGRAIGSHMWLHGAMPGVSLAVECVVVGRRAPKFKEWETVGTPRLLVIGPYRMAVRIDPHNARSTVTIAIDYAMPTEGWQRLLAHALGRIYARWCVRQMARDLVIRFDGYIA